MANTFPAVSYPASTSRRTRSQARTASVHFLRFQFSDEQRDAFRDPDVPARLVVDHPAYADDIAIEGAVRLSLLADLSLEAD